MNIHRIVGSFVATAFGVYTACADEAASAPAAPAAPQARAPVAQLIQVPVSLSLSKAAKLAEEAIAAAKLPADCYLRVLSLQQPPGKEPYYSGLFRPGGFRRPAAAAAAAGGEAGDGGAAGGGGGAGTSAGGSAGAEKGGAGLPVGGFSIESIHVSMDGKVTFEKIAVGQRASSREKPAAAGEKQEKE